MIKDMTARDSLISAGVAGVRGGHSDGEKINTNNNLPVPMTPATPRSPREDPRNASRIAKISYCWNMAWQP